MYLEGLGFRAIGRLLNVSHTAVFYWIKKAGKTTELPVETKPVEVVEVDEMHTYVGKKKVTAGFGLPLTEEQKKMNKMKSKVRCRIEHVFGAMKSRCRDEVLRSIGFARARFWIGIQNLVYNLSRFVSLR